MHTRQNFTTWATLPYHFFSEKKSCLKIKHHFQNGFSYQFLQMPCFFTLILMVPNFYHVVKCESVSQVSVPGLRADIVLNIPFMQEFLSLTFY